MADTKDILIIDLTFSTGEQQSALLKTVLNDKNVLEHVLQRVRQIVDKTIHEAFILGTKETIKKFDDEIKDAGITALPAATRPATILDRLKMYNECRSGVNAENVILFWGDGPLIDVALSRKVITQHRRYLAEYTFCDDISDGITPEVFSASLFERIFDFQIKKPMIDSRRLFENIDADINQFYVELVLPDEDMSLLRLELIAHSRRHCSILSALCRDTVPETYNDIIRKIKSEPTVLRPWPRYIEVELTTETVTPYIMHPGSKMTRPGGAMTLDTYTNLIRQATETYDDIIICFSNRLGDPLLHPQCMEFLNINLASPGVFSTIIETDGLTWNETIDSVISSASPNAVQVIFTVDAVTPELYTLLRSNGDMHKAINTVLSFINKSPENKARTFIQIVKMQQTLDHIESFYDFWEQHTSNIILQRYNSFAGAIDDNTAVDLTPLKRTPSWHLQRELYIFHSGDVPLHHDDFNGTKVLGNINEQSLSDIWQAGIPGYRADFNGDFSQFPLLEKTNDWYVFNF